MAGGGPNEYSKSYTIQISSDALGEVIIDNDFILQCYVIEDIFSVCVAGKMIVLDNQGLLEYGPITGNEEIIIYCGKQEEGGWIKEFDLELYKIQKAEHSSGTQTHSRPMYEIFFVDKNFKNLTNFRYSKSWPEGPFKASDIWKYILTEIAGVVNFGPIQEDSLDEDIKNFYMPWWTPMDSIQWLMKRAKGAESAQQGFLMFSNSQDDVIGLNICTLEKLLMQGRTDPYDYVFEAENPEYRNQILSWRRYGIDAAQMKDLVGGHRIGFDFLTKMRLDKNGPAKITYGAEWTYGEGSDNFTTLGTKMLYPDISTDSAQKPGYVILTGHNESHYLNDLNRNEWVKRYGLQQSIAIQVRGFEGEGRSAGQMINIKWPSEIGVQNFNLNMDGKYLVKSVIHNFGRTLPQWTQKMILIKQGYWKPEARLMDAGKPNP